MAESGELEEIKKEILGTDTPRSEKEIFLSLEELKTHLNNVILNNENYGKGAGIGAITGLILVAAMGATGMGASLWEYFQNLEQILLEMTVDKIKYIKSYV